MKANLTLDEIAKAVIADNPLKVSSSFELEYSTDEAKGAITFSLVCGDAAQDLLTAPGSDGVGRIRAALKKVDVSTIKSYLLYESLVLRAGRINRQTCTGPRDVLTLLKRHGARLLPEPNLAEFIEAVRFVSQTAANFSSSIQI